MKLRVFGGMPKEVNVWRRIRGETLSKALVISRNTQTVNSFFEKPLVNFIGEDGKTIQTELRTSESKLEVKKNVIVFDEPTQTAINALFKYF